MNKIKSIIERLQTINIQRLEDVKKLLAFKKIKFNFKTKHFTYQCLFQNQPGNSLFVLFHGAKDRQTHVPPYFERWSWANIFPGPILHFSDPSLDLDKDLRLAWFIGHEDEYPLEIISEIVKTMTSNLYIDPHRIVTYGSSAGGFCAIAIGQYLKNSISVAVNPQTNALLYYQNHVRDMLNVCFGGISKEAAHRAYSNRLDMVTNFLTSRKNRLLLVQNTIDRFHYNHHFAPLASVSGIPLTGGTSINGTAAAMLYSSEKGHGPEPRQMVPEILKNTFTLRIR